MPATGAHVTAAWQDIADRRGRLTVRDMQEVAPVDDAGSFTLCNIPSGRPVTVQAERNAAASRVATLIFPRALREALLLSWDKRPGQPYDVSHEVRAPVFKLDLELGPEAAQTAIGPMLSGVITDRATGAPVQGALVTLNQHDSVRAREDGTFEVARPVWASGANVLRVQHEEYEEAVHEIWIDDTEQHVGLGVGLRQLETDSAGVMALVQEDTPRSTKLQGFYERRRRGPGRFFDSNDLERISAARIVDILRRAPGVQLVRPGASTAGVTELISFTGASAMCRAYSQQPLVYVDGVLFDVDGLLSLQAENVAAMELYNGASEVPALFNRTGSDCGVIVIWTK
jgi:hypothetical protein